MHSADCAAAIELAFLLSAAYYWRMKLLNTNPILTNAAVEASYDGARCLDGWSSRLEFTVTLSLMKLFKTGSAAVVSE